jgi:WhiB family redox-sensing transcriptional regulator
MAKAFPPARPRGQALAVSAEAIAVWYTLQDAIDDAYISGFSAVCRDDPDMFFSDGHVPVREDNPRHWANQAKAMCNDCVLRDPCLTYALVANEDDGVWGGQSPSDRKQIRKEIGIERGMATVAEIGYANYRRARPKARRGASQYLFRDDEVSDT